LRKRKVKDRRSLKKKGRRSRKWWQKKNQRYKQSWSNGMEEKKNIWKINTLKKKQEEETLSNKWRFQNYTSGGTRLEFDFKGSLKIIF
jgi:hypothetical protein